MLKSKLALGVSCDAEMEHCSNNARKDVVHLRAEKSNSIFMASSCDCIALLVQQLQTLVTQKVATVSKFVNISEREELIVICGGINEYELSAKGRLDGLVGGALASSGKSAMVFDAESTVEVSAKGPSGGYLL